MPASSKPTLIDHEPAGLSLPSYLDLWSSYAREVLHASISFHGTHPTNERKAAEYAANVADAMMEQYMARIVSHKEAKVAEREAEKAKR